MSYLEVLEEEARSQRLRLHIEHQLLRQEENRQLLFESRCGICLCDFSEVEETATICQFGCHHTHAFCAGCLRSAFGARSNQQAPPECPLCKAQVSEADQAFVEAAAGRSAACHAAKTRADADATPRARPHGTPSRRRRRR